MDLGPMVRRSGTSDFIAARSDKLAAAGLPDKSYKRKCQETYLAVGSVPTLFGLGIQPNRLNVHVRSTSVLPEEVVASFRHTKR
jgi:hypothetical protein